MKKDEKKGRFFEKMKKIFAFSLFFTARCENHIENLIVFCDMWGKALSFRGEKNFQKSALAIKLIVGTLFVDFTNSGLDKAVDKAALHGTANVAADDTPSEN
ncbi:MAG: hypothetical protein IJC99_01020 [Clostridia bacterium]|nr:hypothetical protein [Clostridia bacterium]